MESTLILIDKVCVKKQKESYLDHIEPPHIIGHRGVCARAPENTIASMQEAFKLGIKWVEFDVMLAKEGEAVIIHDTSVDRTTSGKGELIHYTYAELKKLDAGSWFDSKFKREKIPCFKEVITFLLEHEMAAVVEIKPYPGYEKQTAEKINQLLRSYWPDLTKGLIVSSFAKQSLETISKLAPELHLGMGIPTWFTGWEQQAQVLGCQSLHVKHSILSEEKVAAMHAKGHDVFAYTINDLNRAKQLFSWGVDAIFTDNPVMFQE